MALAHPAWAQATASTYFPTGTSGYDQNLGVTVLSRIRPGYEEQGIQLGGFTIRPDLDQSIFDNTNVTGQAGSGSWGAETSGSVTGQSDWSRNSLQASVGFDHNQFFTLPGDSYTNWNVGLGGGYTIGDGALTAYYSHSTYNQLGTTIGMARSETPALDTTDTAEINYTFNVGRFEITPTLDLSAYRFGDITADGISESQSYLNRDVIAGGVVTRYELTGAAGLLFVARGASANYIDQQPGELTQNSTSAMLLAGIDYQAESLFRYSLLVGVEHSSFAAAAYGGYTAPIISAQVVYTPTGVLTLTGDITRSIEDAVSAGTDGYVLSQGNLTADYELLRNVLLEGTGQVQYATYIQGGSQTSETVGGSVTWLLNRQMQLTLDESYTNQNAPGGAVGVLNQVDVTNISGAYSQNVLTLTLHLAL